MDFGIYPPEINSGRMYTGPGSGPTLAAALAWESLADELHTVAGSYQSVVSDLTGTWSGASSASMAAAAASYVAWLSVTAAQVAETAAQAKAAVAAFEAAFVSTVPPPVIAANRSLLMALVATNFFGQNTSAIAATEAQYAEMWAQDAAAMFGYAGSSASATVLTPFRSPHQNTDADGAPRQAAAVGQATSTSAGDVQSALSSVPQALSAAPPATAQTSPLDTLNVISNLVSVFVDAPTYVTILAGTVPMEVLGGFVDLPPAAIGTVVGMHMDDVVSGWAGVEETAPPEAFRAIITNPGPLAASAPTMSAGLGEAKTMGALSVPSAWTVEAPAIRPSALSSRGTSVPAAAAPAAAGQALEVGSGGAFAQLGLAGLLGSSMGGPVGTGGGEDAGRAAAGRRMAFVATNGDGATTDGKEDGSPDNPRIVVTGVAARIRQLAELRDEGTLTDEEFSEQKRRLLGR